MPPNNLQEAVAERGEGHIQPAALGRSAQRAARSGQRRRMDLADFLRRRRESLKPETIGLPAGGRRRTPGLRREEVAQLAGVGTTWYTWLEQGRDVRASIDVLEALAGALRLTPAERTHLLLLGRGEAPAPCKRPAERVSASLRRMLTSFEPNPAFLLGRRWDYLAWNRAACALLGNLDQLHRAQRNHVWLNFTDPARRQLFADWERASRAMVAKFRADSAHHFDDPDFEDLIRALRTASPDFCRNWNRHEVMTGGEARKRLRHPQAGALEFEHAAFAPVEAPDQRLVIYAAVPGSQTEERMQDLISQASRNS